MSAENTLTPLEGEPGIPGVATPQGRSNTKQLIAVAILLLSVLAVVGFALTRYFGRSHDAAAKPVATPDVASARAPALQMPPPPAPRASAPVAPPEEAPVVPNIAMTGGEAAPIPVRGGSAGAGAQQAKKPVSPEDAPIFSAGAAPALRAGVPGQTQRRDTGDPVTDANASLDAYRQQLAGMLQNLQGLTAGRAAAPRAGADEEDDKAQGASTRTALASQRPQTAPPLFESMVRSATPTVRAHQLGNRSLTVPKGTLFLCSLKTRVISATSGLVGCQVTRNVLSDDGRVLLIERGSHLDGEYRIVSVRPGVTRIPVLWTRIRTPLGVTVDLDSPATGALGESGMGGYVDNRWGERLGGALLLSLVDDAVRYAISSQTNTSDSSTVVLPNTTQQGSKLAEKVLDATINIPPLLYQNQGGVVGVYVARDLDFSSVYELKPQ